MTFLQIKPIFLFIIIFAVTVTIGFNATKAQKFVRFASSEDVAIAFYKTGDVTPNFKNWIRERDPYKHTAVAKRPRVMQAELLRLKSAYDSYDPKSDYLKIRTYVSLDPEIYTDKNGQNTYSLPISFTNAPDALYFPYDFMKQRIVVVPIKLDKLMKNPISEAQYKYIQEAKQSSHEHTMIITLRPDKADIEKPYEIDGLSQWALTADIVSMEVWDKNKKLLWEYSAPWFLSPAQEKLNNLYVDRPKSTPEIGSVKSTTPYLLDLKN